MDDLVPSQGVVDSLIDGFFRGLNYLKDWESWVAFTILILGLTLVRHGWPKFK